MNENEDTDYRMSEQRLSALHARTTIIERSIESADKRVQESITRIERTIERQDNMVEKRLESMEAKLSQLYEAVIGAKGGFRASLFFVGVIGAGLTIAVAEFLRLVVK